ncbi:MAG: fimbrillin family protein [Candidatus Cryptobacteroides sp.]
MKHNTLYLFGLLLAGLASCSGNEEQHPLREASEIKIEPIITRATSTNFEEGDKIGLSILRSDGSIYAENACLSYSDKVFSSALKWYADGGESSSISAYYPYSEGGVPQSFTVASDQSAGAGASDLMFAFKENVFPQSDALLTVFRHQLSQIVIVLDNKAGAKVSDVVVKGVLPSVNVCTAPDGSLSLETDSSAAPVDIKAECLDPGKKYRVIIAPQKNSLEVKIAVEGTVLLSGTEEADLLGGYSYSLGIEILPDMVNASISGDIEVWEDGGSLGGNIIDESEAEEFDDYIIYRGKSYSTAIFNGQKWMTQPMAYLPEGLSVSDDPSSESIWYPYSSDGTVATPLKDDASIKKFGYLYSYEAVFGVPFDDDTFDDFENAQGLCPKGWHVPNRSEFLALFGYSNKNDAAGETSAISDPSALFWDPVANYAYIGKADEYGFNYVKSGGVANSKYNLVVCTPANCSVEEYQGQLAMTYLMCSTPYKKTTNSYQYFAGISTFTNTYSLGRLSLAYSNYNNGLQLRCVKNF